MALANRLVAVVGVLLLAQTALADGNSEPAASYENARSQEIELRPLLDAVSKQINKTFLIEPRVRPYVTAGGVTPENITYPILLSVLRTNGYAAVTVEGAINVVPDVMARFFATPIIMQADPTIADDEWVTRVVALKHIDGKYAIAVLRPLMHQSGHMAWIPPNALLLVDHYANTQRLADLLALMDKPTSESRKSGSAGAPSSN